MCAVYCMGTSHTYIYTTATKKNNNNNKIKKKLNVFLLQKKKKFINKMQINQIIKMTINYLYTQFRIHSSVIPYMISYVYT